MEGDFRKSRSRIIHFEDWLIVDRIKFYGVSAIFQPFNGFGGVPTSCRHFRMNIKQRKRQIENTSHELSTANWISRRIKDIEPPTLISRP